MLSYIWFSWLLQASISSIVLIMLLLKKASDISASRGHMKVPNGLLRNPYFQFYYKQ